MQGGPGYWPVWPGRQGGQEVWLGSQEGPRRVPGVSVQWSQEGPRRVPREVWQGSQRGLARVARVSGSSVPGRSGQGGQRVLRTQVPTYPGTYPPGTHPPLYPPTRVPPYPWPPGWPVPPPCSAAPGCLTAISALGTKLGPNLVLESTILGPEAP